MAEPLRQHLDDALAVEPAVLDEDGSSVAPGHGPARNEQIRHIRFERLGIELGRERLPVSSDASAPHQVYVRPVASQQQDTLRWNLVPHAAALDDDHVGANFDDLCFEARGD